MLALLLVALSLGLSNFAASVGIGAAGTGTGTGTRLRVGAVFGFFETVLPVLGLLLGRGLAGTLGAASRWLGGGLLVCAGLYPLAAAAASGGGERPAAGPPRGWRLVVTGAALSLDNLTVGFALGTYHVSLPLAAVLIGAVSVTLSLLGLELGGRLGALAGRRGEVLGGLILAGTGTAILAGTL